MNKKDINYFIILMLLPLYTSCNGDDIKAVDSSTVLDSDTLDQDTLGKDTVTEPWQFKCGTDICPWIFAIRCCTSNNKCGFEAALPNILSKDIGCMESSFRGGEISSTCPDSPVYQKYPGVEEEYQRNQYKGCLTDSGDCGYWFDEIHDMDGDHIVHIFEYNLGCLDTEEFVTP